MNATENRALPTPDELSTLKVRWDLSKLYADLSDPKLENDFVALGKRLADFDAAFRGRLAEKLDQALLEQEQMTESAGKIFSYISLVISLDLNNQPALSRQADIAYRWQELAAQHLVFFDLEICALEDAIVQHWCADGAPAARFRPFIEQIRRFKKHQFSEPIEQALTSRASFHAGSWAQFFEEIEADLRFDFEGKNLTVTEMLECVSESPTAERRATALATLNAGFGGHFHKLAAQALYMISGAKSVEDRERDYPQPMSARNLDNQISDEVVEALHIAVRGTGAQMAQRFYRLKAKLLGLPRLAWSDRNAHLPSADRLTLPFSEATRIVTEAYARFSPELGDLVRGMMADGSIDAPALPGKRSGAFNHTIIMPHRDVRAFTLLNYLGTRRDVMTLAHELGHGVHGLLAGRTQGALMADAPLAYCETASVFGEMLTFEVLRDQLSQGGDRAALLDLLVDKSNDIINTVVRQISFSDFERAVHGAGRRLSPNECDELWLKTTRDFYGPEGDVFTYENADRLWAYISHFHRPFYVYAYAFGELLTHSLMAERKTLGERFAPLYLDLLRAGGTKDAVALLAPFGLDPRDPTFWERGLELSLGQLLPEAEKLAN